MSKKQEIERLKRSISITKKSEIMISNELQESLDALSTLEKALIESQDEREKLIGDLHDLEKAKRRSERELEAVKKEKEELKNEIKRLEGVVISSGRGRAGSSSVPHHSPHQHASHLPHLGLSLNEYTTAEETLLQASNSSGLISMNDLEAYMDTPLPLNNAIPSSRFNTGSTAYPPLRHSSVINIITSSSSSSKHPPTPPPSHPPPPLPTSFAQPPGRGSISSVYSKDNQHHFGNPASQDSSISSWNHKTVKRTDSLLSTSNSTMSSNNYHPHPSVSDTSKTNPSNRSEEQEANLTKLTRQLQHCESELKANLLLVGKLEYTIQENERNLRKNSNKMNELNKERNESLKQMEAMNRKYLELYNEYNEYKHKKEAEEKRERDELIKKNQTEALRNTELRMQEIQRLNRKSKFNVSGGGGVYRYVWRDGNARLMGCMNSASEPSLEGLSPSSWTDSCPSLHILPNRQ